MATIDGRALRLRARGREAVGAVMQALQSRPATMVLILDK